MFRPGVGSLEVPLCTQSTKYSRNASGNIKVLESVKEFLDKSWRTRMRGRWSPS